MKTFTIQNLKISASAVNSSRICYILSPFDELDGWAQQASLYYGVSIVVITGIDWDNALTPWKAKGVPTGSPDFEGEAAGFLSLLRGKVIPVVEKQLNISPNPERTLTGVSLSGLFTLWQWLECDEFQNIISISGSFWYEGFVKWVESVNIPAKKGRAYFLLGNKEAQTPVPQFRSVQTDTVEIVRYLREHGIDISFELVPGNHYQYGLQRLERSFAWMFGSNRETTSGISGRK